MVKLLSAALLLLCLGHIAYAWCPWAKTRLLTINKNSVKQLKEMDEHVIPVIYEALKHVKMISQNATTWSRQHLALFKNFLSQQVEELEKCVEKMTLAGDGGSEETSYPALNAYFQKLSDFLEKKELSGKFCGWEVVRKEVIVNLEFLNKFLDNRKKRR
ncbi:interferon beta-like [Scleropages formosus]|uniref:interferon beta-like n=1 Tax=Scleropages formosus TaxID=113540 RepID=UPI0006305EEF|nr:interferon beta-like [Scleropages formosus]